MPYCRQSFKWSSLPYHLRKHPPQDGPLVATHGIKISRNGHLWETVVITLLIPGFWASPKVCQKSRSNSSCSGVPPRNGAWSSPWSQNQNKHQIWKQQCLFWKNIFAIRLKFLGCKWVDLTWFNHPHRFSYGLIFQLLVELVIADRDQLTRDRHFYRTSTSQTGKWAQHLGNFL